jgi:hypothetical protein
LTPPAYEAVTLVPIRATEGERMEEADTFHLIEEDLAEGWVDECVERGVEAIEEYLAKHLAFLVYLDDAAAAQ